VVVDVDVDVDVVVDVAVALAGVTTVGHDLGRWCGID
jgi:hypothetical protein